VYWINSNKKSINNFNSWFSVIQVLIITLHSRMYLPTTTIVLPFNGVNSNFLNSKTLIFYQHLEWWYSSVKIMRCIPWHLNTIIQDAYRMLESCRLTSLNYLIQRKTIVTVGRCIHSVPTDDFLDVYTERLYLPTTTIVLPLNKVNSNWSNNRTQAFHPTFMFFL